MSVEVNEQSESIIGYKFDDKLYSDKLCRSFLNQTELIIEKYVFNNKQKPKKFHCYKIQNNKDCFNYNEIGVYPIFEKN